MNLQNGDVSATGSAVDHNRKDVQERKKQQQINMKNIPKQNKKKKSRRGRTKEVDTEKDVSHSIKQRSMQHYLFKKGTSHFIRKGEPK